MMIARIHTALKVRFGKFRTILIRRRLGHQVVLLDKRDFVLIANNCVSGLLYEMASLPKRTPTIGMFFRDRAYPSFLEGLADGDLSAWAPIDASRLQVDPISGSPVLPYDGRPAVVFLHYHDPAVAAEKWNGRFARLEGRKPIVIASLRDGLEDEMLACVKPRFRHMFVIGPAPSLPADEVFLDARLLRRLSAFFDGILLHDG